LNNPKELVHQIFQLSRAMTSHLNKELAEYNLTHAQFVIIQYLIRNTGSSSLVDIARYLNVEKSSVTRTVNRLEKSDYLEQVPSTDNREKRIKLDDSRKEVIHIVDQIEEQFERNAFKGISSEELDTTFQTLFKIMKNINKPGDENFE
jgi:MarR family transcriptional regulator for hemolysin